MADDETKHTTFDDHGVLNLEQLTIRSKETLATLESQSLRIKSLETSDERHEGILTKHDARIKAVESDTTDRASNIHVHVGDVQAKPSMYESLRPQVIKHRKKAIPFSVGALLMFIIQALWNFYQNQH